MLSKNHRVENRLFWIIMVVAAVLRFNHYAGWSLSNDELSALNRLNFDTFSEMIRQGVMLGDFHPAGVQSFLWIWTKAFGNEVWVVRLPFVIFGIISVYFVYLIGKKWFGITTALFAMAAMTCLEYPILYSQLARPYSPGLLFSLVTVWFWTKIVFDKKKGFIDYSGFTIFAALTAYTHHYSFLFVVVVGLTGLFFLRGRPLRNYIFSGLVVGLLYLPHLNIFLYQFGIGGVGGEEGWLGKPEPGWIIGYLEYAFNDSLMTVLIILTILILSLIRYHIKFTKYHFLSITWFMAMFLIGYFYSILRNPILQYSILLFAFPFLLLFAFSFLNRIPDKFSAALILAFTVLLAIQTIFINKFYHQQHFGEFRDVAHQIACWDKELGRGNITNAVSVNAPFYIHYYLDKENQGITFQQYENRGGNDLLELTNIVQQSETPYFSFGWTKPCPPEVDEIIKAKYPCIIANKNYSGLSEVKLYSHITSDSCLKGPQQVAAYFNDFEDDDLWGGLLSQLDSLHVKNGKYSYMLDESVEYSPGIEIKVQQINRGNFNKIVVSLWAFSVDTLKNMPVVITFDNPEDGNYIWATSKIENFTTPGKWGQAFFVFPVPDEISPSDEIKVYIWNVEKARMYLDDFRVAFFTEYNLR
nr:glycosyltransferase family 39 protein [Bacteroidota bacterium]